MLFWESENIFEKIFAKPLRTVFLNRKIKPINKA